MKLNRISPCWPEAFTAEDYFEKQVEEYIQKYPYQDTYDYVMQ